jgi:dTDP-N-acetylfucosamine:lipid II N-acetylfucosaminyltransferase
MQAKILHLGEQDKFTAPLFALLEKHIDLSQHRLLSRKGNFPWTPTCNFILLRRSGVAWLLNFLVESYRSEKIIIHGLFDSRVIFLLFLQPWLLKKCYWVIWGGDLYTHKLDEKTWRWKIKEFFKRPVAKNIGNIVTYIKGDYQLAEKWYGATGVYRECLMYPSNIFKNHSEVVKYEEFAGVNIQIGNSADPENNHFQILKIIENEVHKNIKIFAPLSYGNAKYAENIDRAGKLIFKDKFIAIRQFSPIDEYLKFLSRIDIAVFAHRRQQAMGNIIELLGMGKKVYLHNYITPWELFTSIGVKIFDICDFNLHPLTKDEMLKNSEIISIRFSEGVLIDQYSKLFE